MTQAEVKNVVERVAWTFLQASLAAWALTGFVLNKGVLIGVGAAGVSAVKNLVQTYLNKG